MDILIAVAMGTTFLLLSALFFKIREKKLLYLFINAALGVCILVAFSFFATGLPLNPLNALITSCTGVFGIIFIYIMTIL